MVDNSRSAEKQPEQASSTSNLGSQGMRPERMPDEGGRGRTRPTHGICHHVTTVGGGRSGNMS